MLLCPRKMQLDKYEWYEYTMAMGRFTGTCAFHWPQDSGQATYFSKTVLYSTYVLYCTVLLYLINVLKVLEQSPYSQSYILLWKRRPDQLEVF